MLHKYTQQNNVLFVGIVIWLKASTVTKAVNIYVLYVDCYQIIRINWKGKH